MNKVGYRRTQIRLDTTNAITDFAHQMIDVTGDFVLENFDATYRVNAKSLLGVMYFAAEFPRETYFVSPDGIDTPSFINTFRPLDSPSQIL